MSPSLSPSTSSHFAITRCATSAIFSGEIGASVSARWFQIAPIVKPVWSTHGAFATMPSKSVG